MDEIEKWLKEIQKERATIEHIIKEKKQMLKDLDDRIRILKEQARKNKSKS